MAASVTIRTYLLLFSAVLCLASAVLFIQISEVPPLGLSMWRLGLAGIVLAPLAFHEYRRHRPNVDHIPLRLAVLPGVVFAAHLVSWVIGARQTPTADASLIAMGLVAVKMGQLEEYIWMKTQTQWLFRKQRCRLINCSLISA